MPPRGIGRGRGCGRGRGRGKAPAALAPPSRSPTLSKVKSVISSSDDNSETPTSSTPSTPTPSGPTSPTSLRRALTGGALYGLSPFEGIEERCQIMRRTNQY
ncbi:hypothetical protein PENARI_c040G03803 [Penicillium arizonense]|uniref:Uncharacterized protein n=1 Tax=Penicillium arizonense TaxID=1835702 RepID=A0A1F5L342_PENAI|nr:hypothetical protein PENARI_c040G03803 [Penicillium arizonense]OGE47615.1 hypothetical protein PENARI_c040G03803 [Penicillium arizonense]